MHLLIFKKNNAGIINLFFCESLFWSPPPTIDQSGRSRPSQGGSRWGVSGRRGEEDIRSTRMSPNPPPKILFRHKTTAQYKEMFVREPQYILTGVIVIVMLSRKKTSGEFISSFLEFFTRGLMQGCKISLLQKDYFTDISKQDEILNNEIVMKSLKLLWSLLSLGNKSRQITF